MLKTIRQIKHKNCIYVELVLFYKFNEKLKRIKQVCNFNIFFCELGREAVEYTADPHLSGYCNGMAPYKEDLSCGVGQWGTAGVERTRP